MHITVCGASGTQLDQVPKVSCRMPGLGRRLWQGPAATSTAPKPSGRRGATAAAGLQRPTARGAVARALARAVEGSIEGSAVQGSRHERRGAPGLVDLSKLGLRRMEEAEAGKVSTCVVLARWSRLSRLARERHRGPAQGYRCSSCFRACLKPQEGFLATWVDLNPRLSPNFSGY